MRIDILAIGSHGDIRPCVALGVGLQRAGHRVRIVTLSGFEELVRANGLAYLSIGNSPHEIAATDAGREWIKHRANPLAFLRGFVRVAGSLVESGLANYWPACRDVEAMVVTGMGLPIGMHIAERVGVPLMRVSFAPSRHDWRPTQDFGTKTRARVEAWVWTACRVAMWSQLRARANTARQNVLELPPLSMTEPYGLMDRQGVLMLDAYSPAVVPRPANAERWFHVTGYWFLDDAAGWKPPAELEDFLAAGSPPVFVGFGSTPFPQPDDATRIVVAALHRAGRRGIVVAGGSGLRSGRLAHDVLSIDSVPHSWLFSRVSAAVHHGGAGVTGAALRAGLASVVVPIFGDQPFWGRRVFELGVASRPIPAKRLSADALANAIRDVTTNEKVRHRAAALGGHIRKEDGVARAVKAIEDYLAVDHQARHAS